MISWELIWGLFLLITTLVFFISEKYRIDMVAVALFGALVFTSLVFSSEKWPSLNELLSVFSNPAPLSIGAMFIVSSALERCGIVKYFSHIFMKMSYLSYPLFLGLFLCGITLISAFVNNTIVVIVFMPIILSIAHATNRSASKYLIPLSYASIFGGCCTLMGTSTNILASDVLNFHGYGSIKMLELLWIGGPAFIIATLYLMIFGDRLLPNNTHLNSVKKNEEKYFYLNILSVTPTSHYIGCCLKDISLIDDIDSQVLYIERDGNKITDIDSHFILNSDDRLWVACSPDAYLKFHWLDGLELAVAKDINLDSIVAKNSTIVEGIVGPKSHLIGKTIQELNQQPFSRLYFLGIRQIELVSNGENIDRPIALGDILLMVGTKTATQQLNETSDVYLLNQNEVPMQHFGMKQSLLMIILGLMIFFAALDLFPIVGVLIVTSVCLIIFKILPIEQAYHALDGRVLSCLYAMMALGITLDKIGLVNVLTHGIISFLEDSSSMYVPYYLLFFVYAITMFLTEILSNNATVLLMAPLALKLAETAHLSPKIFVMAACIASSAGFMLPTGYQTHTYVYGAGHYRFLDFIKIGWPLNLIYAVVTILIAPYIWPF